MTFIFHVGNPIIDDHRNKIMATQKSCILVTVLLFWSSAISSSLPLQFTLSSSYTSTPSPSTTASMEPDTTPDASTTDADDRMALQQLGDALKDVLRLVCLK